MIAARRTSACEPSPPPKIVPAIRLSHTERLPDVESLLLMSVTNF
jgi:hypothetical protein